MEMRGLRKHGAKQQNTQCSSYCAEAHFSATPLADIPLKSWPEPRPGGIPGGTLSGIMDMIGETEQQVRRGLHSSLISIAANCLLALSKCLAGFLGHSFALVADGIESLSDVFSSAVVYFGLRFAIKPPDKEHPYGHGKAEPVAAAIVSLAMGAAAIAIAAESIALIRTPHPLPRLYTLWVLVVVFAIKIALSRYVWSVAKNIESTAVSGDAWHHFSDAITSLFAFVGISAALWTR